MQAKNIYRLVSFLVLISLVVGTNLVAHASQHTVSAQTTTNFTFTPVADAYITQAYPDTNYGTGTSLRVDNTPLTGSYLRFTVSGLNGASVQSAKLRIYANSSNNMGLTIYAVADNTWGEKTITFNNSPATGGNIATAPAFGSATWVVIDLSSYIKAEGTYSMVLTTPSGTNTNLASRESGANAPQLVISAASLVVSGPTATKLPPTATSISPTATKLPPTATSISPTATKISPTATAAPSNVYYVSTTGSDSNPGTQSLPWATIQKAANTVPSGGTALVLAGTYSEQITVSTSGITLQAQGKVITKRILVSGNSDTIRGFTVTDPTSDPGIWTEGDHNLIEGNEIYHTHQDGIWFFGSYNTYRGNYIHDILDPSNPDTHVDCFQTWGWNWNTTNDLFERNLCINNSVTNYSNQIVQLEHNTAAEVRDITFRNNVFVLYYPVYSAFNFWGNTSGTPVSNITVVNNTIVNMTRSRRANAIQFYYISGATAINNLSIDFGDSITPYIGTDGSSSLNIHNNAVYTTDGVAPEGSPSSGDVWMKNPMVVSISGLDFHLQSSSPLINVGYNLGSLVPNDKDGVARPQGTGYDIGAYEYPMP